MRGKERPFWMRPKRQTAPAAEAMADDARFHAMMEADPVFRAEAQSRADRIGQIWHSLTEEQRKDEVIAAGLLAYVIGKPVAPDVATHLEDVLRGNREAKREETDAKD